MEVYSSSTHLIPSGLQHKTRYPNKHTMVESQLGEDGSRRTKRNPNGDRYACVIIVGFFILATVIAMTIIGAVYINHLMTHVSQLEQRVLTLESRPCNSLKSKERELNGNVAEYFEMAKLPVRSKRGAGILDEGKDVEEDPPEESFHHRSEHHGIASHNIAMVYGDPSKIVTKQDASEEPLRFKNAKAKTMNCNGGFELKQNGKGDYWCKRSDTTDLGVESMMFTWQNHMYYYFQKASWMNTTHSIKNYNLTHDGRIVVRQEGIYIIHASIHFTGVGKRDTPHYGVYRTNALGENRKLVSKCVISLADQKSDDGSGVYPCQAWQLTHLNHGDQVFMSIGGYTWFEIEKETFHLTLIKLNDYNL